MRYARVPWFQSLKRAVASSGCPSCKRKAQWWIVSIPQAGGGLFRQEDEEGAEHTYHYSGTSRKEGGSQPTWKPQKNQRLRQVSLQSLSRLLQHGNGQVVGGSKTQGVAVVADLPMRPPGTSGDAPLMMSR